MIQDYSIKTFFEVIPPVVYSGILGACIALFGTYLQNRFHSKQQKERLEHESAQKKVDREMTMRRDIFILGAESIGKMQLYLFSFLDVNAVLESQQRTLEGVNESFNKISLIASYETIEKLTKLDIHFKKSVPVLAEKRMEFSNLLESKKNIESFINSLHQEMTQLHTTVDSLHPSKDKLKIDDINIQMGKCAKTTTNFINQLRLIEKDALNKYVDLLRTGFDITNRFEIIASEINLVARQELNFPIDEQKYLKLIEESVKQSSSAHKDWIKNITEKY